MKIKATRKLYKQTKYTYAITLSSKMIKLLKWREGQKVDLDVSSKHKRILVKDWKPKNQLSTP